MANRNMGEGLIENSGWKTDLDIPEMSGSLVTDFGAHDFEISSHNTC